MNQVIKKISASIHSVKELSDEYGVGIRTIGFCEMPTVLVSDEFFDNNFAEYDKKIFQGSGEIKRAEIGGIAWLTAKVVKE